MDRIFFPATKKPAKKQASVFYVVDIGRKLTKFYFYRI